MSDVNRPTPPAGTLPIPQPQTSPLLGNLRDIDPDAPVQSLVGLARTYGPIFRMSFVGRDAIFLGSQALVHEVCDESRFQKLVHTSLKHIRDFAGDGLFTAYPDEPNWAKAHRLLMPAFGPIGVRAMFDRMLDIAEQMMVRWERFGPDSSIDVADNMTRLTLDTIALCAFDYRFNSFYQNEMHPFVDAMVDALHEAGARSRRPAIATRAMLLTDRRYQDDIRLMHRVADELIERRRRDPAAASRKDLLSVMLEGADPRTGERLSDENIRYQMVTFLIAGHETTSGLLSFAVHFLLRHPAALAKARGEVDSVLGADSPTIADLGRLRYLEQVLMETLRLWPTAPSFGLRALADTTIGGGYPIRRSDAVMVLIPSLHRDPAVWGPDAESFQPERFDGEAAARLPPDAWKPFGNGARACIGRAFAMQEAMLVLALMLQRFDLIDDQPAYRLKISETLTLKPAGLRLRVRARGTRPLIARPAPTRQPAMEPAPGTRDAARPATGPGGAPAADGIPLLVLFGSNTGSCESFAQRIAGEAPTHGFLPTLAPMDEHVGHLPTTGPVVVLTASYEGRPPDNAVQFVGWLGAAAPGALTGVRFAVFGCGNRQWARTYQAVPKQVDGALEAAGGQRLLARGETDAGGDFFGGFEAWLDRLWQALAAGFGGSVMPSGPLPQLEVDVVRDARTTVLRQSELGRATIVENRELVDLSVPGSRSKRHVELALPAGMTYRAGDYLAVLPRNPQANVDRALRRFGLEPDSLLLIRRKPGSSALPAGQPIPAGDLFGSYVELAQPATRAQLAQLAAATRCPPEREALVRLDEDRAYEAEVLQPRISVLDLIERHPGCDLSLATFLSMLPPMRTRQYSISSSPLWNPAHCTLTLAVVDAPATSGHGRFLGVASNFLAAQAPGSLVPVAVRPSSRHFHPPAEPAAPMILICAGTGIAPFRGFLQERAVQQAAGQTVGRSLLFFGCDRPDADFLYRDELAGWSRAGVVDVRPAFSAQPQGDVCFVQDRLWQDRADVEQLFRAGATVFVCGDGRHMAPAVRATLTRMYREATGSDEAAAEAWVEHIERETGRYVADVFA